MKLLKLLQPQRGIRQGDWVETSKYKGIYIISPSNSKSIIAVYAKNNSPRKSYITVDSSEMNKIDRIKDSKLYNFARKHLLWRR